MLSTIGSIKNLFRLTASDSPSPKRAPRNTGKFAEVMQLLNQQLLSSKDVRLDLVIGTSNIYTGRGLDVLADLTGICPHRQRMLSGGCDGETKTNEEDPLV